MVAWYWILISIMISNFLTASFFNKIDFENLWEKFLSILIYPFIWIGSFPYIFFRNFFIPTNQQKFEKIIDIKTDKEIIYKLSKNLYLWHDKKTQKIHNRWFLVRIKEEKNIE